MDTQAKWLKTPLRAIPTLIVVVLIAACAGAPTRGKPLLTSKVHVDLKRYMGTWYVIGHVPYFGERGKVATRDEYTLAKDGNVATTYVYRKSFDGPLKTMKSLGVVQPNTHNHYWIVHFWWLFRADYLILDIAPDYSWVLIGQPSRKLGWIMARKPAMESSQYEELLHKFSNFGYAPSRFERVPQLRSQLGQPGFEKMQ